MAYDFTGIPSMIEIGGVRANSWGKILELDPEVKDAVFEMPATIEITSQ